MKIKGILCNISAFKCQKWQDFCDFCVPTFSQFFFLFFRTTMFKTREIHDFVQGDFSFGRLSLWLLREWGRRSVNVTKCNENETLKHDLAWEHFCLSHVRSIFIVNSGCSTINNHSHDPTLPHTASSNCIICFHRFNWETPRILYVFLYTSIKWQEGSDMWLQKKPDKWPLKLRITFSKYYT